MNLISWNIKGLGGDEKQGVIRKFIREKKVFFLGLIETKCSKLKESIIRKIWCDDEYQWAMVHAINMSGGLLYV